MNWCLLSTKKQQILFLTIFNVTTLIFTTTFPILHTVGLDLDSISCIRIQLTQSIWYKLIGASTLVVVFFICLSQFKCGKLEKKTRIEIVSKTQSFEYRQKLILCRFYLQFRSVPTNRRSCHVTHTNSLLIVLSNKRGEYKMEPSSRTANSNCETKCWRGREYYMHICIVRIRWLRTHFMF